jgi:hypothetical protein
MARTGRLAQSRHVTHNIDQHVGLIAKQVRKSLADAETRQLAVKIVSGKVEYRSAKPGGSKVPMVEAWGQWFEVPEENLKPCPPRNDLCEVELIWNFVVKNCRYVFDTTDVDVFTTAEQTLKAGGGDCDDATVLFAALLKSVGFYVRARVISTPDNPDEWVHIYPLVGMPKSSPSHWLPLDCTVTGALPGWEYESIAKTRDYDL